MKQNECNELRIQLAVLQEKERQSTVREKELKAKLNQQEKELKQKIDQQEKELKEKIKTE